MASLLELDVSDVPVSAMIKKPTAGQLKEKPDEKGLIYVYSQLIQLSKYTAELSFTIEKYSQNIEIKRVTT